MLLLDFWGTWCGSCVEAVPGLKAIHARHAADPDFKLISLSVDDGEDTSGHQLAGGAVGPIEHRLPGEHGFRFFPGFYKHVVDTMRRIPSFDGRKAADHLTPTTRVGFTQYVKPDFVTPAGFPLTPGDAGALLRDILLAFEPNTELTPEDLAFFGARIWQTTTATHRPS